jgi:hypothetical protein
MALAFWGTSCRNQIHHESRILFKNSTNVTYEIVLFPKPDYKNGKLYRNMDNGAGSNYTTFEIAPNSIAHIFYSGNPDYQPNTLVSLIFDSIQMRPLNQDQATIRFSPEKVIGYPLNIFKDSSAWKYEYRMDEYPLYFSTSIVEVHEYTFDFQSLY